MRITDVVLDWMTPLPLPLMFLWPAGFSVYAVKIKMACLLRILIKENRWRAQRYGLDEGLVDFGRREITDWDSLIDEIIELVGEDAERLGCLTELEHLRVIRSRGTSAHLQLDTYDDLKSRGLSHSDAMRGVVDALIEGTKADL